MACRAERKAALSVAVEPAAAFRGISARHVRDPAARVLASALQAAAAREHAAGFAEVDAAARASAAPFTARDLEVTGVGRARAGGAFAGCADTARTTERPFAAKATGRLTATPGLAAPGATRSGRDAGFTEIQAFVAVASTRKAEIGPTAIGVLAARLVGHGAAALPAQAAELVAAVAIGVTRLVQAAARAATIAAVKAWAAFRILGASGELQSAATDAVVAHRSRATLIVVRAIEQQRNALSALSIAAFRAVATFELAGTAAARFVLSSTAPGAAASITSEPRAAVPSIHAVAAGGAAFGETGARLGEIEPHAAESAAAPRTVNTLFPLRIATRFAAGAVLAPSRTAFDDELARTARCAALFGIDATRTIRKIAGITIVRRATARRGEKPQCNQGPSDDLTRHRAILAQAKSTLGEATRCGTCKKVLVSAAGASERSTVVLVRVEHDAASRTIGAFSPFGESRFPGVLPDRFVTERRQ